MREGCRLGKWRRIPLLQGVSRLSVNGKITMDLSILSVAFPESIFPRIVRNCSKKVEEIGIHWSLGMRKTIGEGSVCITELFSASVDSVVAVPLVWSLLVILMALEAASPTVRCDP